MKYIIWLIPLVVGGIFLSVGLTLRTGTRRMERICSAHTPGCITEYVYRSLNKGGQRSWHPTVTYSVGSQRYTKASSYGTGTKRYEVGDEVTVWYAPDNPSYCYIEGYGASTTLQKVFILIAILLIVLAICLWSVI